MLAEVWEEYAKWWPQPPRTPERGLFVIGESGALVAGVMAHVQAGPYVLFTGLAFNPDHQPSDQLRALKLIASAAKGVMIFESKTGLFDVRSDLVKQELEKAGYVVSTGVLMAFVPGGAVVATVSDPTSQEPPEVRHATEKPEDSETDDDGIVGPGPAKKPRPKKGGKKVNGRASRPRARVRR